MQKATTTIQSLLTQALETLAAPTNLEIQLEHPANPAYGDWSSNVAMVLFQQQKAPAAYTQPRQFAQAIVEKIQALNAEEAAFFSKVEVAGPGFINFTFTPTVFIEAIANSVHSDQKSQNLVLKNQKIIVEFTDPNPFKEFHIGHLYSNIVGEAISRLLAAAGAEVQRVCYQGDVGMHVAKSVWGIRQKLHDEKLELTDLVVRPLNQKVKFLGQAYALGATRFEEDKAVKKEIQDINYLCFVSAQERLKATEDWQPQVDYRKYLTPMSHNDQEVTAIYQQGRAWSLEYFNTIYTRLGTRFDDFYFESVVGEYGIKIVREFLEKGVFEESQGAVIFPGSKYGLHDRVFINSLGLPTYECKELGLAPEKYRRFPYDQSIIITGNEIDEYFKVLLMALGQVRPELAAKTKHFSHGMVRLPEGKMSSRTGKILTGEWLIDEAKKEILDIFSKTHSELNEAEKEETAEKMALGAIKFALLKHHLGADIAFSFEESLNFQGNSGPYVQYTVARALSVLRKAAKPTPQNRLEVGDLSYVPNEEEMTVFRQLYQFSEVVETATVDFAPHHLCTYLFSLAQAFNAFYNKHSILGDKNSSTDPESQKLRLLLTEAVAQTIHNGLDLLGIQTVEKM